MILRALNDFPDSSTRGVSKGCYVLVVAFRNFALQHRTHLIFCCLLRCRKKKWRKIPMAQVKLNDKCLSFFFLFVYFGITERAFTSLVSDVAFLLIEWCDVSIQGWKRVYVTSCPGASSPTPEIGSDRRWKLEASLLSIPAFVRLGREGWVTGLFFFFFF